MKFIASLLLFFCFSSFSQEWSIREEWKKLEKGSGPERIEAAKQLTSYYDSESLDSLRLVGEMLFFYGIDEHYQPAIEWGKIILAEFYVLHGRMHDGISMAKELIPDLQERSEYDQLNKIYRTIASGYRKLGDGNSTLVWAQKAVMANKQIPNNKEPYAGQPLIAEAYLLKNNIKKALEIYLEYIQLVQKDQNYRRLSSAYARIGDIYRLQGNLTEAEKYFKLSYQQALKTNLTTPKTHALNNLAIIYFENGNLAAAKENFTLAMELREKINDVKSICESYFNMGEFYFYTNAYKEAVTWYNKSISLAQKHQLLQEERDACVALAGVYKAQGEYDEAFIKMEKALAISNQIKINELNDEEDLTALQHEIWKSTNHTNEENATAKSYSKLILILGITCGFLASLVFIFYLRIRKSRIN